MSKGRLYEEEQVATAMGLPVERLREMRRGMSTPEEWTTGFSRSVVFTAAGIAALLKKTGLALKPGELARAAQAVPGKEAQAETPPGGTEVAEGPVVTQEQAGKEDGATGLSRPTEKEGGGAVAEKEARVETLVVLRTTCRNRQILLACIKGRPHLGIQKIRVRSKKNFVPLMECMCRHSRGDVWALMGKLPRLKGRW